MLYNIIALKIIEYMALAVIVQWTDAAVSAPAYAAAPLHDLAFCLREGTLF